MKLKKYLFYALTFIIAFVFFKECFRASVPSEPQKSAFEVNEDIKSFICSQYSSHVDSFELVRFESLNRIIDEYHGIIKFTFYKKGVKYYSVNNFITDEDGYLKEITYSHSLPYKDLKIEP